MAVDMSDRAQLIKEFFAEALTKVRGKDFDFVGRLSLPNINAASIRTEIDKGWHETIKGEIGQYERGLRHGIEIGCALVDVWLLMVGEPQRAGTYCVPVGESSCDE